MAGEIVDSVEMLRRLVAFDTTSRNSNLALIEYVQAYLKGHGIGWKLMQIMIEYAQWQGLKLIEGQVLRENRTMLAMCESLGFTVKLDPEDPTLMHVRLPVTA